LGTPVVATDCPTGPSEILTGELSQWLVPLENAKALAEKIDKALDAEIRIKDEAIAKFNKKIVYENFVELL
jgi:glycosyltransferase involved in cell wall biosynthesis